MKLKEALIAWTPKWLANPVAGDKVGIAVEPFRPGAHTITKQYKSSWGACNTYVKKLTRKQATSEVMQLFNALVLRDGPRRRYIASCARLTSTEMPQRQSPYKPLPNTAMQMERPAPDVPRRHLVRAFRLGWRRQEVCAQGRRGFTLWPNLSSIRDAITS